MSRIVAGIDPGISGAVGFLTLDGEFVAVADMPVLPSSTGRHQVDSAALAEILRQHAPRLVMVERVGARPGEGAVGAFSFGMTFGAILGVLGTLQLPHYLIQPAQWKRAAGIPPKAEKAASIAAAKQLVPSAAASLTLKKHDGRAESLLIARHAIHM